MSKMRSWGRLLLVAVLLAAVPAVRAQEEPPESLDEEFAQLADQIPGFGGMYLDQEGTLHVYLVDLRLTREAEELGEHVEVHQGDYDFRDLFAWKDEVRPLLAENGAVFLDIDEQRNRLLFGVEAEDRDAFVATLQSFLRSTRVPSEAVLVEVTEPIDPLEKLTDKIRPVPMGVQIQRTGGGTCTLGVNAFRLGIRGFVTCSHCTATRSVVDGTVFFQSTTGSSNQIGVETVDPPFFVVIGGCPPGRLCRKSDAVFAAYDSPPLSAGGKIANPISCGFAAGPLTVDSSEPRIPVTTVSFNNPLLGFPLKKVGRTTGCTLGSLMGTCVDTNVSNSSITMLCQNRVGGTAAPGDSGSPVFLDDDEGATLYGVLWGVISGSYVYSPWKFVASELGGFIMPEGP